MRFRIGFASLAHLVSRRKYTCFIKHPSYCWPTLSYLSRRDASCPLFAKYTSGRTYHVECEFERPGMISWQPELANSVQLIGHLGSDVDIRYLQTGKVVASSSLAVNKPTLQSKGGGECMWFQLEFWEELAEIAASHFKKGTKVFVSGEMMLDTYSSKDNVQKLVCKIVARDLKFVGDKPSNSSAGPKDQKSAIEELWQTFFEDPSKWWDDRVDKINPKAPDFVHKSTREGLWIEGRTNPVWVMSKLSILDSKIQAGVEDVKATGPTCRKSAIEELWQTFFKDPSKWWDDRADKLNPKSPDFKHKLTGDALWINSLHIPEWVNIRLAELDSRVDTEDVAKDPMGSGPTARKKGLEILWQDLFKNPSEWWDNRERKLNPKSPDFKHKLTGDVLWINGLHIPEWVNIRLTELDSRVDTEDGAEVLMQSGSTTRSIEKLWKMFFESPSEWWDNRENKINPRGPDFKHKSTGEGLWVVSRYNPEWVNSELATLDNRSKDGKALTFDATGSGMS